jgi:3-dehydroquinate dehydratase-2
MMSKNISIINGPNLNLLGKREPGIYGTQDFDSFFTDLQKEFPNVSFTYFQSNVEGELINELQRVGFDVDGIVFNPGGYTHTSVAIGDAVAAISSKVIEVHISNVFARESFRQHSFVSPHALGIISGLGLHGYILAIQHLLKTD